MRAEKSSSFSFTHCFWSFTAGVCMALAIAAGVYMWISNAPIPFVAKVQTAAETVDPSLLDGKTIDPNKALYADGQGAEQTTGDIPTIRIEPEAADSDQGRFWVQAGAFSQNSDAESIRARIAFVGLDAQISYRNEGGQRLYRVRIGPFDRQAQAEEVKQSLADSGIQGTVLRLHN